MEPRVKLYVPREESFSIPVKFFDVTRNTRTSVDVMLEKSVDDYWNVDGNRELSDAWTVFTRSTLLSEKPPDGFSWSGRRLTRKQTTSRPDTLWPEMRKHMSDASKRKEKQKWTVEKPKLENARRLRGIYLIDPEDEEFQITVKNTRRKLEIPMPAAMPCKALLCLSSGETCRTVGEHKTKHAWMLKLTNLGESEWNELFTGIMKIILQEEALIHRVTIIWCTSVFPCLKQ